MNTALCRFLLSLLAGLLFCRADVLAATVAGLAGQSATLSASAGGTAPFTYQWYKNGVAISGATSASYAIAPLSVSDSANYTVKVSNSAGTATSVATTLEVSDPFIAPSITGQPQSLILTAGQTATFSVSASGTAPFSYQWFKNGVAISGETAASLSLANVGSSDVASYSVTVSNTAGTVSSLSATLDVLFPPAITSQPAGLTVNVGKAASFSVAVAGTAPFSYQWNKNGVAIAGANAASYSIATTTSTSGGTYSVVVSNAAGSTSSAAATLTIISKPTITSAPKSVTVVQGQPASFTVVASSTVAMKYQWKKDGVSIPGATSATYSISATTAADAGSYNCYVSNSAGTVGSAAGKLIVNVPVTLASQPAPVVACVGQPASFSVTATGTAPFTYQWNKNGVAISGATASTFSLSSVSLADAADYSVKVTNIAGSVVSSSSSLTVVEAPTLNSQPMSLTVNAGKGASFSVSASSNSSFSYQWNKNGVAIAGANAASYKIAATAETDAGAYTVTVSNAAGSVTSQSATLVVNPAPTYNRVCTISVRTVIDAVNPSSVVGFATEGTATRRFLVRGVGPGLAEYGATNVLSEVKLEVHSNVNGTDTLLASNTGWSSDSKAAAAFIEAGAFALVNGSKDAAAVVEVPAGAYTIVVSGNNGSTGTALVELYELP